MDSDSGFIPLSFMRIPPDEMARRARDFGQLMAQRRSVRQFSSEPVDRTVVEDCIRAAGAAPSGANQQPWRFVIVEDPVVKRRIREAAEKEEHEFYASRAPDDWIETLRPLGTDEHKPFLETAPFLIVVMAVNYGVSDGGDRIKHYYVSESVGIATGFLIAALHNAGLACLTHTPSPMGFLGEILNRPSNERPFLLIPVGYPTKDAEVPDIGRKSLDDILTVV